MTEEQKITIEVDAKDALARHIESLQRTLTKRNRIIEQLEERLNAEEGSPAVKRAFEKGIVEGWKRCAQNLMNVSATAERELANVVNAGWKQYLSAERISG